MRRVALCITVVVLLTGCKPATPPTSSSASSAAAGSAVWEPTATPFDKQDVADLLRSPPSSGESVEIDAYFSGATAVPHLGGFPPLPDQIACPNDYETALTDRPFLAYLAVLNSIDGNPLPDNAPWLIAVTPDTLQPGIRQLPQLPYHAQLRGHLGEAVLAHCEHADRIFVVDHVMQVYEEKPAESFTYSRKPPDDYATWTRYHDAGAGFSLSYPSDWQIDQLDDATWNLHSPQWPDLPIIVRVHSAETHLDQYDSTSMPPLLQGITSFGVYEQGGGFSRTSDSQHLTGYQVSHDKDPTERSVSVLFSGSGHTYELAVRYPLGFDAPQPLLTAYSVIVEGFRLDVRPGPSPTPPVKQGLGAGPFLSQDEALSRVRDSEGHEVTLLEAKLVPEAEARQSADACNTFESHPDGVWMLTVRGVFEDQIRTLRMYLDATTGEQLCGEEIILNATPWPTLPPHTTATPVPSPANSTRQSGGTNIPTPSSSLVKSFLWQTDGLYGYRMLRPAGWEPIDMKDRRGYQPLGLPSQADQVLLMAFNLQVVAKATESPTSLIAQWGLFERDHSLAGWTGAIEQLWTNNSTEFTLMRTLPQAKIYLLKPASDLIWVVAYAADKDQPLTIGLEAHGAYADEARLQKEGLLDDFATMVGSISAIQPDPSKTDPAL